MSDEKTFDELVQEARIRKGLLGLIPMYFERKQTVLQNEGEMSVLRRYILGDLEQLPDKSASAGELEAWYATKPGRIRESASRIRSIRSLIDRALGRGKSSDYIRSRQITIWEVDWKILRKDDPDLYERVLRETDPTKALSVDYLRDETIRRGKDITGKIGV